MKDPTMRKVLNRDLVPIRCWIENEGWRNGWIVSEEDGVTTVQLVGYERPTKVRGSARRGIENLLGSKRESAEAIKERERAERERLKKEAQ